ncbi:MAG: DeoR/GlpR transcriptional regulator [Pirellulaceae bacterium]|mgnify:CR=1 FL=1|nr:DeoR/GlpR transcriptional regulator [Pirellulaceae bacterium]
MASPEFRRREILRLLDDRAECSVDALAERFGVSGMTIRRDLRALAADGRALRTHGGAAPAPSVSFEFQFLERSKRMAPAKEAIAAAAAELVEDGQTVMLDSGTTTLAVARRLRAKRRLTVVTTSLPIAAELHGRPDSRLILLGGLLRQDAPDLVGPLTEANIENLHADAAFIGADGVDTRGNVYTDSLELCSVLAKMTAAARRTFIVADHEKVGRRALARFATLAKIEALITDGGVDRKLIAELKRRGVPVIVAPPLKEKSR